MCRNIPFQLPEMPVRIRMSVKEFFVKLASFPCVISVVLFWTFKYHVAFPRFSAGLQVIFVEESTSIGCASSMWIVTRPLEKITRCDCVINSSLLHNVV